jgi:adenylate cyclase
MRRRDRASRKAAKARRRKTLMRSNAPKAARGRRHLATSKEANVAQLIRERDEALEQQAATADVLRVISRSAFNLQTMLDTLVQCAARLCEADIAAIGRPRDTIYYYEATYGFTPEITEFVASHPPQIDRSTIAGRVLLERKIFHVPDVLADPEWTYAGRQKKIGRTMLGVPLLREGVPIGVISFVRNSVRPFTDKQIELATTFADQAVIAIENTRLLNELRQRTGDLSEALEQQTATSKVLGVISSSPGELKPVFQSMLENAVRICEASFGNLLLYEHDAFRHVALHNAPPAWATEQQRDPVAPRRSARFLYHVAETKQVSHIADITAENPDEPIAMVANARTLLIVPMLKENELIGAIAIYRQEVRPFTEKQIELVKNFAAQAVIAIENTRLLDDLNKLNQQLGQRVTDQVSEIERMGRLRRFLPPQVADLIVASGTEKQLESHRREITALFCDLRGFTGFSESSDPEDVMALLREYHAAIGGIINTYGGTLERYAGDGVMVVFNDPIPVDNPALQAVLMAIEMRAAIGALIEKWRKLGHDIGFGIGIAHGFATLGTIGFEGRFDYAAIGTVSNVASRLCDEAKPGQILISPRVLMAVEKDVTVEPVGDFALKGIRRPLTAHNVLDRKAAP